MAQNYRGYCKMRIEPVTTYLTESDIAARANKLIDRYNLEVAPIVAAPVTVEAISDL